MMMIYIYVCVCVCVCVVKRNSFLFPFLDTTFGADRKMERL